MAIIDGLISYWELDDGLDSHGTNHLTDDSNDTTFGAGKVGNCATFNGTTASLHRTPIAPPGEMSVAFWVNPTDDAATSIYVSQFDAGVNQAWQIFQFGGNIYARIHEERTGSAIFIGRLGGTVTEAWQFVVVTYTGGTTAAAVKIYRNASQVDTTDTNNGSFTSQDVVAAPVILGAQRNTGSIEIPLAGKLDEVGWWDRELSGAEITWLYNAGTGRSYASVVAGIEDQVATPTIDPNGGSFETSVEVTLDCATVGATIYYTTNGDTPDDGDTEYTAPFTLTESSTVKAIGIDGVLTDSEVASAVFTAVAILMPQILV